MGYVNGMITIPSSGDPDYAKWEIENSLWLVHCMIPSIGEGFLSLATAKDVREVVADTYSRKGNVAQIYDLKWSIEN